MSKYVTDYRLPVNSKDCKGQFQPPNSKSELQKLLDSAVNGVIWVRSRANKLKYSFQGVENMQELIDALLYTVQEDYKSGIPTYNAKCGYSVYSHAMYGKVKRRLYGV